MTTPGPSIQELFELLVAAPADEREERISTSTLPEDDKQTLRRMLRVDDRLGDAADQPSRRHPWPGDVVGEYRLIAPIGSGGMGNVWRAHSLSAPELMVAVKFANWTNKQHAESAQRLRQEGSILAAIRHPGVVSLVGRGETDAGRPYIVLEELLGPTLDEFLERSQHTAWDIAHIMLRLCEAASSAHVAGVIHRDIKPSNIIVAAGSTPVLVDFGAAAIVPSAAIASDRITQGASPMTPAFASPEQSRGELATPATDVYALGLIMRLALKAVHDPTSGPAAVLQAVAARACSDDPAARYPNAKVLADDLAAGLRNHAPSPITSGKSGKRSARIAATTLAIGLAIGTVTGSMVLPSGTLFGFGDQHLEFESIGDGLDELAEASSEQDHDTLFRLIVDTPWVEIESGPEERLEVARLQLEAGAIDAAMRGLEAIEAEELEPTLQLERDWLVARADASLGYQPEPQAVQRMLRDAIESEEEATERAIVLHGVASGDASDLQRWLEWDEPTLAEPWEPDTETLVALLSLTNRLTLAEMIEPLSDELLDEIEERIGTALDGEDILETHESLVHLRGLAHLRTARMLTAIRDGGREIVVNDWLALLDASAEHPADLVLTHCLTLHHIANGGAVPLFPFEGDEFNVAVRSAISRSLELVTGDGLDDSDVLADLLREEAIFTDRIGISDERIVEIRRLVTGLEDEGMWTPRLP